MGQQDWIALLDNSFFCSRSGSFVGLRIEVSLCGSAKLIHNDQDF